MWRRMEGYQRFWGPQCLHLQGEMKIEAAWVSETLVFYITTWRHNPADNDMRNQIYKLEIPVCSRINEQKAEVYLHMMKNTFPFICVAQFMTVRSYWKRPQVRYCSNILCPWPPSCPRVTIEYHSGRQTHSKVIKSPMSVCLRRG